VYASIPGQIAPIRNGLAESKRRSSGKDPAVKNGKVQKASRSKRGAAPATSQAVPQSQLTQPSQTQTQPSQFMESQSQSQVGGLDGLLNLSQDSFVDDFKSQNLVEGIVDELGISQEEAPLPRVGKKKAADKKAAGAIAPPSSSNGS